MAEPIVAVDDEAEEERGPGGEHDRGLCIQQHVGWRDVLAVAQLQGERGSGSAEAVPESLADVVVIAQCGQEAWSGGVHVGSVEELEASIDDRGDPPGQVDAVERVEVRGGAEDRFEHEVRLRRPASSDRGTAHPGAFGHPSDAGAFPTELGEGCPRRGEYPFVDANVPWAPRAGWRRLDGSGLFVGHRAETTVRSVTTGI